MTLTWTGTPSPLASGWQRETTDTNRHLNSEGKENGNEGSDQHQGWLRSMGRVVRIFPQSSRNRVLNATDWQLTLSERRTAMKIQSNVKAGFAVWGG